MGELLFYNSGCNSFWIPVCMIFQQEFARCFARMFRDDCLHSDLDVILFFCMICMRMILREFIHELWCHVFSTLHDIHAFGKEKALQQLTGVKALKRFDFQTFRFLPCVVKSFVCVISSCHLCFRCFCIVTDSSSSPPLATLRVTVWSCLVVGSSCW